MPRLRLGEKFPLLITSVVPAKSSKQMQLHTLYGPCWCCLWLQHRGEAESVQPFCRSFLAKTQLKLRGSSLCCNHGGLQHVSASVPSGIATAQLLQEASQERTQPPPLALSFLALWAVSGAVDGVGSGAESVLQGFCFVFAWCQSPCNAPGARQPGLVVRLTRGRPSPCFVHPHLDPSVLQQVSERCNGLLQSCLDTLLLHEK